jgi:hypothetical protein
MHFHSGYKLQKNLKSTFSVDRNFAAIYLNVTQQVPQYYIASYLGLTPEQLSRIRNKVNNHSPLGERLYSINDNDNIIIALLRAVVNCIIVDIHHRPSFKIVDPVIDLSNDLYNLPQTQEVTKSNL